MKKYYVLYISQTKNKNINELIFFFFFFFFFFVSLFLCDELCVIRACAGSCGTSGEASRHIEL